MASGYAVTSTVYSNGQCVEVGEPTQTIFPAFSVAFPTTSVDRADFLRLAQESFVSALGLPTCSQGGAIVRASAALTSTALASANATRASSPSTSQATDSASRSGINQSTKIGVGVAIPVGLISLAGLVWLFIRKRWKKQGDTNGTPELSGEKGAMSNPHFLELPDDWRHPELEGLPFAETEANGLHEAPGKEHAQELE